MDIPIDFTFEIQLFSNDHILRDSVRNLALFCNFTWFYKVMGPTNYLKKITSTMSDVNLIWKSTKYVASPKNENRIVHPRAS